MHIKTVGNLVFVFGILVLLISLFADNLNIGGSPGFGPGQNLGLIIGPVLSFIGFKLRGQSD